MIRQSLSLVWATAAPAVANHLWQSTLFAAFVALLTLFLRNNHARVRYWLWLAASLKFLVPFSLLVELGSRLARLGVHAVAQAGTLYAMKGLGQPFAPSMRQTVAVTAPLPASASPTHLLGPIFVGAWFCGFVAVLCIWVVRWRRISRALQDALPLREGREVQMFRRVEYTTGIRRPLKIFLTRSSLEPGILGLVRPLLVLPEGLSQRMDDAHLHAILAHEACHVKYRDNLAAAVHMVVEALFWFYPVVWWLGARLVAERERACDEEVLEKGNEQDTYAESILKVCEFCLESELDCVSGVAGSDLKKRIKRIMTQAVRRKLDMRRKVLLGAAGFLAIALPVGLGLAFGKQDRANKPQSREALQAAGVPAGAKFKSVSIRPNNSDRNLIRLANPANDGKFEATNIPLKVLIQLAYGVQGFQLSGGPAWLGSARYDIRANSGSGVNAEFRKLSYEQGKLLKGKMLQALLAQHFKLRVRRETKQLPVYTLVVAENGPELQEARDSGSKQEQPHMDVKAPGVVKISSHKPPPSLMTIDARDEPISELANTLSWQLGRTVLDKTGLTGKYDFTLKWLPTGTPPGLKRVGPAKVPQWVRDLPAPSGPSIFTAVQQQLGLKLQPEKGPVPVLVIDHVEQPTPH